MSAKENFRYVLPPHEKVRDAAWPILAKDVRRSREVLADAGLLAEELDDHVTLSVRMLEASDGQLGQPLYSSDLDI